MIAHVLMVLGLLMNQAAVPAEPSVVFVCEHGAAKSVIATAYFNKIAAERGLHARAVYRGVNPQTDLSVGALKGLRDDGLTAPDLTSLQFLVGQWEAVGTPAGETGGFTFAPGVQGRVIVRTNTAHYAATGQRPESRHDDLMVIYADGVELKADYFDNEGHVIQYLALLAGPGAVSFVSEVKSGEPRYRLSYTIGADGLLSGQFEMALPGAPEVFKPYLTWSARRVK